MECNKDEATRAKELAETRFTAKDLAGAKKFALKAQNLYPALEGIHQMIATLDVYISAENKINGEADWYGILGVNPAADDDTVRKHYRKLALILHPDKNKSIGSDGAFKLVSEAWSLLSDRARRVSYDQKRNVKTFQKFSTPNGGRSVPSGANGFATAKTATTSGKTSKSTSRMGQPSTSSFASKSKQNTFWTVCHRCKMHYEYLIVYLNHNLLCPNCHEPFLAIETAPPTSGIKKNPGAWEDWCRTKNQEAKTKAKSGIQWSSSYTQAATAVQQAYEKVKKEREEAQAATKKEAMRKKRAYNKRINNNSSAGDANASKRKRVAEDSRGRLANFSGLETGMNGIDKPSITRDRFQLEIRNLLIDKAKKDISKKLHDLKSLSAAETASRDRSLEANGPKNADANGDKSFTESQEIKEDKAEDLVRRENGVSESSCVNKNAETVEAMSINVLDADFYDFDKNRDETSFGENQVWAAYDNDDGMPRFYAMIHRIISLSPFKMQIRWLNSNTNSELGPLNWVASGFTKTCGEYRLGKHEVYGSVNSFSHKVRCTKGSHGVIHVYPRKGDVWALYRNWLPEWNELTADEVIHTYDIVEVLDDFDEEHGVLVIPLVKVAGFKTVFHQHLDAREVRRIPREEMFRFSHQVPAHFLTGHEASKAPRGCWELDPAATPPEFLEVIMDVKDEEILDDLEDVTEDRMVVDLEIDSEKETMKNVETTKEECIVLDDDNDIENVEATGVDEVKSNAKIPDDDDIVISVKVSAEDEMMEDVEEKSVA